MTHLLRVQNSGSGLQVAQGMLAAFQRMKGIALKRATRVANLEGQLQGHQAQGHHQAKAPSKPTYREILTRKEATWRGARTWPPTQEGKQVPPPKDLVVKTTDAQTVHPKKVQACLKSSLDLQTLGIKVSIWPPNKGVAIYSHDGAGLERLATAIDTTPGTKTLSAWQ